MDDARLDDSGPCQCVYPDKCFCPESRDTRPVFGLETRQKLRLALSQLQHAHREIRACEPPHFQIDYDQAASTAHDAVQWLDTYLTTIEKYPEDAGYAPE